MINDPNTLPANHTELETGKAYEYSPLNDYRTSANDSGIHDEEYESTDQVEN